MNFPCTTAAFTLSLAPDGFHHLVLTHLGTEPSMRFLSVGPHVCARASFRRALTDLPLPSASSYIGPHDATGTSTGDFYPISSYPCRAVHKALLSSKFYAALQICRRAWRWAAQTLFRSFPRERRCIGFRDPGKGLVFLSLPLVKRTCRANRSVINER